MKKTRFIWMLVSALCLASVYGRAQSNQFHTMTFINDGGGYFSFVCTTPDGQRVDTSNNFFGYITKTIQVQEGSSVLIGLSSEKRGSYFYGEIRYQGGAPRMLHFYVDNREVPLDSIYCFYDEEGHYYWYSYALTNVTSDHTFRAVYGQWDEDLVSRPVRTVKIIGNMACSYESSDGNWVGGSAIGERRGDTLFLEVEEGLHFGVDMGFYRPGGMWSEESLDQPLHLYVDDVEIPLDSLSSSVDGITLRYDYSYQQMVTSDHTVRLVSGPIDTTQLPPLHTIEVVNQGGGEIDYDDISGEIYWLLDNPFFQIDTIPFLAEEGRDYSLTMYSIRPETRYYDEYTNPSLLHFYVDEVEVPLDSIYIGSDGAWGIYAYRYTFSNITSSHTVRAVFGQWDDTLPSVHAMTVVNHGGGKIHSPRNKNFRDDLRQLLVSGGDPFTIRLDSYRSDSPYYGDYANPKLLHFYVDDVEIPLSSMFSGYDEETHTLQYAYTMPQVTANHIFRAEFGLWSDGDLQYVLTLAANDTTMGTVAGGGIYLLGESATLTATPKPGYLFSHWDDGSTDNPRTVVVTADATYVAYFEAEVGIADLVGSGDVNVWSVGGNIRVSGVEGMEVRVYDITGRRVGMEGLRGGVYMVKVGPLPARRVVVIE